MYNQLQFVFGLQDLRLVAFGCAIAFLVCFALRQHSKVKAVCGLEENNSLLQCK